MEKKLNKLEVESIFLNALTEVREEIDNQCREYLESYEPSLDIEQAEHHLSIILAMDCFKVLSDDLAFISDRIINEEFSK